MEAFGGIKPVACAASSALGKGRLLELSGRLSKGSSFVLLMKDDRTLEGRLLPAFMNAYLRHSERGMRSGSLQKEVLLFAAGTMNIGKAIGTVGLVDSGSFMVLASGRDVLQKFITTSKSRVVRSCRLQLDMGMAVRVTMAGLSDES